MLMGSSKEKMIVTPNLAKSCPRRIAFTPVQSKFDMNSILNADMSPSRKSTSWTVFCVEGFSGKGRPKRRRFKCTESFDVPAKDVPSKLHHFKKKHKVALRIRQKYIKYKLFMAEDKDHACHKAREPASSKQLKILKREPYASKRCGCSFRIRAIVPFTNYNEK